MISQEKNIRITQRSAPEVEKFNPEADFFTGLVPVESEMRKEGLVPVFEFLREKDGDKPVAVRILDKKFRINIDAIDEDAIPYFRKWEDFSDVTFMNERTAEIMLYILSVGKDGSTSALVGLPGATKTFGYKLAAAILNIPIFKFSSNADVDKDDLYGGWKPKVKEPLVALKDLRSTLQKMNEESSPSEKQSISEEKREEVIKLIDTILEDLSSRDKRLVLEWEYEYIASRLEMTTLMSDAGWERDESLLAKAMRLGGIYLLDEASRMRPGAMEGLNPVLEWNPSANIDGKVHRKLNGTEQLVFDETGIPPKDVVPINEFFGVGIADNPSGQSADSNEYTDAIQSRIEMMVVENMDPEELEQFMLFMIFGEQPDITTKSGMVYHGHRGVDTPYQNIRENYPDSPINSLEQFSDIRSVLIWLSRFQADLNLLIEEENIGAERKEIGGKRIFDLRAIEYFLEHLVKNFADEVLVDESSITTGEELQQNVSLYDAFMDALETSYLNSFVGEDRRRLDKLVEASGLDKLLGDSGRKGPGNIPDWVVKARNSGMTVESDGSGGFSFSNTNVEAETKAAQIEMDRKLATELNKETTGLIFDYDYINSFVKKALEADFEYDVEDLDPEKSRKALEERVNWFLQDYLELDLSSGSVNVIFNGREKQIMVEGVTVVSTKRMDQKIINSFVESVNSEEWSIYEQDGTMYIVPKVSIMADTPEYKAMFIGQEGGIVQRHREEGEKK